MKDIGQMDLHLNGGVLDLGCYLVKGIDIMDRQLVTMLGISMGSINGMADEIKAEYLDGHDMITEYRLDGMLHRPNGPAVEWGDKSGYWMLFGARHRYYGRPSAWYAWIIHGKVIKV